LSLARAALVLRKVVKCWQPTIIHANFAAAALVSALARSTAADQSAFWLATFHGLAGATGDPAKPLRLVDLAERWAARRMSKSFVLNDEDYAYLLRRNPHGHTMRHPGFGVGCDLKTFDPQRFTAAEKMRVRRSLGCEAAGPVLAFVGRRTAFKGFPETLSAFQRVRANMPEARLILVGEADRLHGPGTALPQGLPGPGVVDAGWTNNVADVLAIADLFILPSVREGMPVSLMEALAMGVPCITMNTRGCRAVVRDQIDGVVLATRESEVLATTIISLLQQPSRLQSMAKAAYEGRDRFDRARYVASQLDVYRSLIAEHAGAAARFLADA
jgi:glycosyltransferase involved in cell wall biosynthesis